MITPNRHYPLPNKNHDVVNDINDLRSTFAMIDGDVKNTEERIEELSETVSDLENRAVHLPYSVENSEIQNISANRYLVVNQNGNGFECLDGGGDAGGFSGTVYANWYEKETGEYHLEKVGNGDPETELQEIFATKEQALAAAKAKFKRTAKANKTFRFSIAGRTDLFAESPIVLRCFDLKIPTKWIMNRVEHSLSSNGFVTNVDCCNGAEK